MNKFTDFHIHILPGIDDGAADVEVSLKMLQLLKEQDVNNIVATPHFYFNKQNVESFMEKRAAAYNLLKEKYDGEAKFVLGAEVYYCSGINMIEDFEDLTLGNSNYIMLELPYADKIDKDILTEIEKIMAETGLTVVFAHIERFFSKMTFTAKRKLSKMDAIFQINLPSLLHEDRVPEIIKFIKKNNNIILGSDSHNLDSRSPLNYQKGIQILADNLTAKDLDRIITDTNKFFDEIY